MTPARTGRYCSRKPIPRSPVRGEADEKEGAQEEAAVDKAAEKKAAADKATGDKAVADYKAAADKAAADKAAADKAVADYKAAEAKSAAMADFRVTITSNPEGADVYRGKDNVGTTPMDLTWKPTEDTPVLTLVRHGFQRSRVALKVSDSGKTRTIELARKVARKKPAATKPAKKKPAASAYERF